MMKISRLKKQWGAGLCVFLAACGGATYIAETWNAPVNVVATDFNLIYDKTAMREMANGSLRVTYRTDSTTLATDTYDNAGTLLQRQTFADVPAEFLLNPFEPLFVDDDTVYWISKNYQHSRLLDLATETSQSFPTLENPPLEAGNEFLLQGHVLLENGRLVMIGQDHPAGSFAPLQNRIVILNPDGTYESRVAPMDTTWGMPFARSGDQYYVVMANDKFAINEGLHTIGQISLDDSPLMPALPVYSDANGIWYSLGPDLHHRGTTDGNTWTLEGFSIPVGIASLDMNGYAVLHYDMTTYDLVLSKITLDGTLEWTTDVATNNFLYRKKLDYNNGRILLSQDRYHIKQSFMVDDSQEPPQTILTGKRTGSVIHMQLDLNGKITARYREPDYQALLLRDLDQPAYAQYVEVLEHTPGSCGLLDTLQLSNGNLVSLSDWCTDQVHRDGSAQVYYFTQP